jgi:hypothetical protein
MRVSRAAQRFADAVDGGAVDSSVVELAGVASALRVTGAAMAVTPNMAFRAELRQRLVAVATVQDALPVAAPVSSWRERIGAKTQRRVAAVASAAALSLAVSGVGVAASRSLPGDAFYGVKRATENVQLFFTPGVAGKGHRHLEFAATRLKEARELHDPSASRLRSTLQEMNQQIVDGRNDLIAAYRSSQSAAPLVELNDFSRNELRGLALLAHQLPPQLRVLETPSVKLVTGLGNEVRRVAASSGNPTITGLLPGGSATSAPKSPGSPVRHKHGHAGTSRPGSQSRNGNGSTATGHRHHGTTAPVPVPTSTRQLLPTPVPSILQSLLPTSAPKPSAPIKLPSSLPASILKSLLPSKVPSKLPLP